MKRALLISSAIMISLLFASPVSAGTDLQERLKGQFLLSVEKHGELWYSDPVNGARTYVADAPQTWMLIKSQMIGITNADLNKLPLPGQPVQDIAFRNRLQGRFLLAVEDKGEVWYVNPADGYRYYLGIGEATYQNLKGISLGITLDNLDQIPYIGRSYFLSDIQPFLNTVDYNDSELGWEFATTLWSAYEQFYRDHEFYPEINTAR